MSLFTIFKEKCTDAFNRSYLDAPEMWWSFVAAKKYFDFPLLENFWFLGPLFPPLYLILSTFYYIVLPTINLTLNSLWAGANLLFSIVYVPIATLVHVAKDSFRSDDVNALYEKLTNLGSVDFEQLVEEPLKKYKPSSTESKTFKAGILRPEVDPEITKDLLKTKKLALHKFFKDSPEELNAGRGITSHLLSAVEANETAKINKDITGNAQKQSKEKLRKVVESFQESPTLR
ncbi:MAG: hypothetical protein H0T84_08680 [Tatlockia sp.]|nr:hypothetical protein [Tatlockia sp.]